MKRKKELAPVSREHDWALLLARNACRAARNGERVRGFKRGHSRFADR